MESRIDVLGSLQSAFVFVWRLSHYALIFMGKMFQPKASLVAENLAMRSQLAMCKDAIQRKKAPQPSFDQAFRLLWVAISKLHRGWEALACLMQPATVKRWHETAFRIFWRWKSKPGRPKIPKEMQSLIRRLSTENPLWGGLRIRQQLELLGYESPCEDTILKYMAKPVNPRKPSTTWLPFLRNHLDVSWAIDFFTVTTLGFRTLYVFVILEHGRRKVRHFATTYSPSLAWTIQQLRNAMPWEEKPEYLFRDNDGIYGDGVLGFLDSCDVEEVRTAYRSPWQNPFVERFFGSIRREMLDHVIILNQRHLERLLSEFIETYYHAERPHQGLHGETPTPRPKPVEFSGLTKLVSIPVLRGLHHYYRRVAA